MSKLFDEAVAFIEGLESQLERREGYGHSKGKVSYHLSDELGLKAAVYFHEVYRDLGREKMQSLWAKIQRPVEVLFAIHPYVRKITVMAAHQWDFPESYDCTPGGIVRGSDKPNPELAMEKLEVPGHGPTWACDKCGHLYRGHLGCSKCGNATADRAD